jgi:RHS repeat-associated protein
MAYLESASISAAPYQGQKASTSQDSIMKNVNLYRGALSTNITLVSLDGPDELDLSIAAAYQPEDDSFFHVNRCCKNGILGTGLSLPLASISVHNRGVRDTYQSDYYLVGEGGEFPLYRTGTEGDAVTFLSVEHPFWRFRKFSDRWEVTKEDGSVWTYGASEDSTEVNVSWGNWTGSCTDTGGEQYAVGWYLSKVVSRFGNSIAFTYENIRLPLACGSMYTSEMHLKTAVSAYGQTIRFNYLPKSGQEYTLPHDPEKGTYQFLCERHFLDSLDVYSPENVLLHSQQLGYDLVPTAAGEVKRLLTSVSQVDSAGEVQPPLTLTWHKEGDFAGHLAQLTYPREGSLAFSYDSPHAQGYEPDTFLGSPDEGWSKAVSHASDFSAVLLTKEDKAILRILSWDMSWQIYEDASFGQSVKNPSLFLGDGIVAIRYQDVLSNSYCVHVVKRVPVRRYDWETFDVSLGCTRRPSVACGADFVAIQYPDRGSILIYQFDYQDNKWHPFQLPIDNMGHQVIGAGTGCVFGAYGYDGSGSVRLATFYCDCAHQWLVGSVYDIAAQVSWESEAALPVWSINGSLASACFIQDDGGILTASVIAVTWDETFTITGAQQLVMKQPGTSGNPIFYCITTDTMIGFANTAMRYTPAGFHQKTLFSPSADSTYAYAYGCDLFLGAELSPQGGQRFFASRFDPLLGDWTTVGAPYADPVSDCSDICRPLVSADYAVLGNAVFVRNPSEQWDLIGYLPQEADLSTVRLDPSGGYLLYFVPQISMTRFVPLSPAGLGESLDIYGEQTGNSASYEANGSCFFLSPTPGQPDGLSFRSLYRQQYVPSGQSPCLHLLSSVTLDAGTHEQTVHLGYDMDSARLESGSFAAGKAWVCPVSPDGSYGRTDYTYYNGASPDRTPYPPVDDFNNAADFYSHFAGQTISTVAYDGEGNKISQTLCDMKAFDDHGFCLQQTRLQQTNYVPRYNLNGTAETVTDGILTTLTYTYEPTYYRRRKTLKTTYDKSGTEICLSYTTRYAFEDYPEMEASNLLNDVTQSIGQNETTGQLLDGTKYEYAKNELGAYYQSAAYSAGRAEGEWFLVSQSQVNDKGQKCWETDQRGLPTAYLYDTSGLYPVAITRYAMPEEVCYCGFEPYEVIKGLGVSGSLDSHLTTETFFSGSRCLKLAGGEILSIQPSPTGGVRVRVSIKSAGKVTLTASNGVETITRELATADNGTKNISKDLTSANNGAEGAVSESPVWESYIELLTFAVPDKPLVSLTLTAEETAYIDALYVTPLSSMGKSYVYTGPLKLQSASHSNTGIGTRTYFDRFDTPCAAAGDDGSFISYQNTVYMGGGAPNEMTSLQPSSYGYWYDAHVGYQANPLFAPQENGWQFASAASFALVFSAEGDLPSLTFGNASLTWSQGLWTLHCNGASQTMPAPKGKHYTLIKAGNRCRFSGDGSRLFDFVEEGVAPLQMTHTEAICCIGYLTDPKVSLSCADYTGRVLQDQIVTKTGIRIVHTLYTPLGIQSARTTQTEITNAFWGYRKGFVSAYDENTGLTQGEVCSLLPEAEGYPCTSYKTTLSSSPQLTEAAQPGKSFAFGSGYTIRHAACSGSGLDAFFQAGYTSGERITDPDGTVTLTLNDGLGKVLNAKISADGTAKQITAYENDGRGNPIRIYMPNYFSDQPDAKQFVSVITYDALGNISSRKDPDADKVLSVYDRFGNLRFLKQEEAGDTYIYHLYDKEGRETEIGKVNTPWDTQALEEVADAYDVRPQGGITVRQMTYNTDHLLSQLITCINGTITEECFQYDSLGRQTQYTLTAAGKTEQCFTAYDMAGNVVSRSTGKVGDGVLTYAYDETGSLQSIFYNGTQIYQCGYSPQGSLAFEQFAQGSLRRDYSYNTANYLTRLSDSFMTQDITYFDTAGKNKNGQISSVKTTFHMEGIDSSLFPQSETLSCTYDSLGRVNSVEEASTEDSSGWVSSADDDSHDSSGSISSYTYDLNGNTLGSDLTYVPGTDRLARIGSGTASYAGFGGMTAVSGAWELTYDPVTQLVTQANGNGASASYVVGSSILGWDYGDGTTLSLLSEDGKTFLERGPRGTTLLVYGANGAFAQICDGKVYYLLKDYRSSVRALWGGAFVLAAYQYDLYGNCIKQFRKDSLPAGLIPLGFAGGRLEPFGLYRFQVRFYDPRQGRFVSPDPASQYPNPYLYGGCDWINYFDPSGAWSWQSLVVGLLGAVIIAAGVVFTVATAGIGGALGVTLGIVGAGIIGAGVSSMIYAITSAVNKDFSWSNWGVQVGMGAAFGMISAGIGAAMPVMGAAASIAYDTVSGMIVGACDGMVTNGILNVVNGKEFFDHVVTNVVTGAVLGGFMGALTGMSTAARNAKSMVRRGGPNQEQLGLDNCLHKNASNPCGRHSRIGIRENNAPQSSDAADLIYARIPGKKLMHAQVKKTTIYDYDPDVKWINITPEAHARMQGPNSFQVNPDVGVYSQVFNSCTGYVIRESSYGGIYQPLWARSPGTLNLWAALTTIFQV